MPEIEIIKALCNGFSLGKLKEYHTGKEGVMNKKYRITTDKGLFFIKVYNKVSKERLNYICKAEIFMQSKGVPVVPMMVAKSGNYWLYMGDNKYIVNPFIQCDRSHNYTDEQYRTIGKMSGRIHWAGSRQVPRELFSDFQRYINKELGIDKLKARRELIFNKVEKDDLDKRFIDFLDYKISILDKIDEKAFEMKDTIIHSDLHPGNILFDNYGKDIVGIVDWEGICFGSRITDLVTTIIYSSFIRDFDYDKSINIARNILKGYREEFPISNPEIIMGFNNHLCKNVFYPWIEEEYYLNIKGIKPILEMLNREWYVTKLIIEGKIQKDLLA